MKKVNVLVLDDTPVVRSRLAALLGEVPGVAAVLEAGTVIEASELLRSHAPGVVVIDVRLRGESGLAFVPVVRRERPATLVIILTNEPTAGHRRECVALGVEHFFDKSRQIDELLRLVAASIAPTGALATSDR